MSNLNQKREQDLRFQFNLLKFNAANLWEAATLLTLLNRADISTIEDCEIEAAISGITTLLNGQITNLEERLAFIEEQGLLGGNDA